MFNLYILAVNAETLLWIKQKNSNNKMESYPTTPNKVKGLIFSSYMISIYHRRRSNISFISSCIWFWNIDVILFAQSNCRAIMIKTYMYMFKPTHISKINGKQGLLIVLIHDTFQRRDQKAKFICTMSKPINWLPLKMA